MKHSIMSGEGIIYSGYCRILKPFLIYFFFPAIHISFLSILFSQSLQSQFIQKPNYSVESGIFAGFGKQTPFWIQSNRFGKYENFPGFGFFSVEFNSDLLDDKCFGIDYGLELFDRYDGAQILRFQQAWLSLKMGFLSFGLGRKEEYYDLQKSSLTSGSLLYSSNARPMPKIWISTNGYTAVPYTKNYVQFNALLAHGWFGAEEYVKNAWLHQKHLIIKVGGSFPVNFAMGLRHYAVWAGTSPDTAVGRLPSDLKTFHTVFFSKNIDKDSDVPENERINKLGNHLGSWVYSLNFNFEGMEAGIGYETIFEDYSGFSKMFMRDGFWSVWFRPEYQLRFLKEFRYEYMDTRYQSGTHPNNGMDNYFNNSVYLSGWTYKRRTLGNPLISSPAIKGKNILAIVNNRVRAHHFGTAFEFSDNRELKILLTGSLNLGTYSNPFPEPKMAWSGLIEWQHSPAGFRGWTYGISLATDFGEMYGQNAGILFVLKKGGMVF